MLSELINKFNNGEFDGKETAWFRYYPTKLHKMAGAKYAWYMPIQELKKYSQLIKNQINKK